MIPLTLLGARTIPPRHCVAGRNDGRAVYLHHPEIGGRVARQRDSDMLWFVV